MDKILIQEFDGKRTYIGEGLTEDEAAKNLEIARLNDCVRGLDGRELFYFGGHLSIDEKMSDGLIQAVADALGLSVADFIFSAADFMKMDKGGREC